MPVDLFMDILMQSKESVAITRQNSIKIFPNNLAKASMNIFTNRVAVLLKDLDIDLTIKSTKNFIKNDSCEIFIYVSKLLYLQILNSYRVDQNCVLTIVYLCFLLNSSMYESHYKHCILLSVM